MTDAQSKREELAKKVGRLLRGYSSTPEHADSYNIVALILQREATATSAAISEEHERMLGILEEQQAALVEACIAIHHNFQALEPESFCALYKIPIDSPDLVEAAIRSAHPDAAKVLTERDERMAERERQARLDGLREALQELLSVQSKIDIPTTFISAKEDEKYVTAFNNGIDSAIARIKTRIAELERAGKEPRSGTPPTG